MTNADRIRAMSDEELVAFMEEVENESYRDSSVVPKDKDGYPMDMLEWLKQEVANEG